MIQQDAPCSKVVLRMLLQISALVFVDCTYMCKHVSSDLSTCRLSWFDKHLISFVN